MTRTSKNNKVRLLVVSCVALAVLSGLLLVYLQSGDPRPAADPPADPEGAVPRAVESRATVRHRPPQRRPGRAADPPAAPGIAPGTARAPVAPGQPPAPPAVRPAPIQRAQPPQSAVVQPPAAAAQRPTAAAQPTRGMTVDEATGRLVPFPTAEAQIRKLTDDLAHAKRTGSLSKERIEYLENELKERKVAAEQERKKQEQRQGSERE